MVCPIPSGDHNNLFYTYSLLDLLAATQRKIPRTPFGSNLRIIGIKGVFSSGFL